MTDAEFDRYVAESVDLFRSSAERMNNEYDIGQYEQWNLDQSRATLEFLRDSRIALSCRIIALGSYTSGSWKWAWANDSLLPQIAADSTKPKALKEKTGMDIFEMATFEATSEMPWEIAGMALREIGGLGIYRCPSRASDLFVLIKEVNHRSVA
jgi:hypothetical protein